jgi:regulation of enolase protein 1 (concanavalin A-like superfamily)
MTGDLHGTDPTTMWMSAGKLPNWIQYEFDAPYKLHELWVWNSNQLIEPYIGFGAKDVTVEYSVDGATWTALAGVPQFAQGTALPTYTANTIVKFGGVTAKYVKLTINKSWSSVATQTGLSEVRFFYVPVQARLPQPAAGATGVSVSTALNWRPGRDAASHKVYFGTDPNAVANGTAPAKTVTAHAFDAGSLLYGTTYYWKVDEVGTATYPGQVWSFTTQEFAVVDDFEGYNDTDNRIYDTWIDGWTNGTGSTVGYLQAPFAETKIIHSGKQSMPLEYNNVKTPFYSEAQRTFDTTQNWTTNGADTLSLWFQGYPVGFLDKGNNAYTMSGSGTDIWNNSDQFRFAYKSLSGNGSITARVDSIGSTDVWAKGAIMIRETLDASSKNAAIAVSSSSGVSFQWRDTLAGASVNSGTAGLVAPYWVRITRTGNVFKAEYSADGKTWTQQGVDTTITMAANVFIGLAVTSHNAALTTVAQISNVSTTGTVTGAWQSLAIGMTMATNDPASLYLVVEDKAGKKKTVVNPDAAATAASAWTEWRIPLSTLSGGGVNLTAVKKITLGVGNSTSPQAGAAGMLYIDDILFGKPILPVGLVANYTLENNVKDVTGNGHDGTILGTPTYVTGAPGKGMGMLFPGTPGNAVNLGTFDPSEKTGMLSVSLWAKWNGLSTQWQGLIGKRDTWAAGKTMWQLEANQTTGVLSFGQYAATAGSGNQVLKVGEWTHLAVTFDKTTARFYVNGLQTNQGAFSFGPGTETSLQFGCDSADGNAFNGTLDEVRLYDVVLTDAQVLALAGK